MCILDCWPSSLEAYPPMTASPDLILLHSGFLPLLPAGAIMTAGWPLIKSIHSFTQLPGYLLTTMHRHCVRCLVAMVNKTQCFSSRSIWATRYMRDNCSSQCLCFLYSTSPVVSKLITHLSLYGSWRPTFLWNTGSHEVLKTILI